MPRFHAIPQIGRETREYPMKAGETYLKGAAVLLDVNEEVVEAGADPATVLGFAAHQAANRDVLTDRAGVNIAKADNTFLLDGDDAPTVNDVNQQYGVLKDGDGIWHVDGTDVVNVVVEVVAVDLVRNLYECKVIDTVRQLG